MPEPELTEQMPAEQRDSSSNTDSKRVLVTKRAIVAALMELTDEIGFARVSVGDILERSGVSRTTFYRCFEDKYDVANWAFMRFKEMRPQFKAQYHSFASSLLVQLDYIKLHRAFFSQVLLYKGQNSLHDEIFHMNLEYIQYCWMEAYGTEPDFNETSKIVFCAAGFATVVERWILEGCREVEQEVVDAICAATPPDILKLLF